MAETVVWLSSAQRAVLALLESCSLLASRELYEGAGPGGRMGCGLWYVTYSNGTSPVLNTLEVQQLVDLGYLTLKWEGCYVWSGKAGPRE